MLASVAVLIGCIFVSASVFGESDQAWLTYGSLRELAPRLPREVSVIGDGMVLRTAAGELVRALGARLSTMQATSQLPPKGAFLLGRWEDIRAWFPELADSRPPPAEAYWLRTVIRSGAKYWLVIGGDDNGALYGTFNLLGQIAQQKNLSTLNDLESPSAPIRWVTEWDNLDGSIERGYAGRSVFFEDGKVRDDLTRVADYARLLASVGINGCVINNVNADTRLLRPEFLPQIARVADAFRPWGVRLALSVDLSSPKSVGGLSTFDPLDAQVATWWKEAADRIYKQIPDFAGFVVKADSEGRSGPSQYGRSAADAANVIARALRAHRGVVIYRGFVYDHHLDWRDPKADRAKAAYDYFHLLDGELEDNVVLQIKYGPIDFQVREPVSPLFGAMPRTNEAIELQVTQEYTGQQRHLCFLVPMWKEILDFDMHVNGTTPVRRIVSGDVWHRRLGGYDAVVNIGLDHYWLGHPLAMANLYGYGRLAWNPDLTAQQIAEEWTRLTFGNNERLVATVSHMLLSSWRIYESYTGPLGLQTLTDIIGPHYGPDIESSENNGWGQWHRADAKGVGMDRTVATGTGFIGQYSPDVQKIYEPADECPDDLLLFMHHVPYTFVLHSGKTVIQYLYDSHYFGAEQASSMVSEWKSLHGLIDDARYNDVLKRQEYQAGHAIVWRDAVVNYFHKLSRIEDTQGRVGHNPNRIEAESMELRGYTPVDVTPWETASGGKGVACSTGNTCSATFNWDREGHQTGGGGFYTVAVQYFDLDNGVSHYELLVNDKLVDCWAADDHLPSDAMNGHTSTRHTTVGVELKKGDVIRIVGHPGGAEAAPLDYIELVETIVRERQ